MADQNFKEFIEWAGRKGYDTAHTYDTERSKWIPFGGMTAELWICWQAACEHAPTAPIDKSQLKRLVCQVFGEEFQIVRAAPGGEVDERLRVALKYGEALMEFPNIHASSVNLYATHIVNGLRAAIADAERAKP